MSARRSARARGRRSSPVPEPRIEVEARLRCNGCQDVPFVLWRRQVIRKDGEVSPDVFQNVLWGKPGSSHPPPANPHDIRCPDYHEPLVRVGP